MLTQEDDQQLVERVQRGDKRAFDLLVLKYQHKILGLIVRFVHDTHEAQDVAQEAFIKAYRALGNFRGDSAFYTWLYRIAINTAKNYLVSRGRRPPDSDVSSEDIASVMQCPVGTVRSRIFRAREAIDKALQPLLQEN